MMKLKLQFIILLTLFCNSVWSQESLKTAIIEPFQKDALIREKVFIHTNKTVYFTNENIWFMAYVGLDHNNSPSDNTSNLIVNLLNTNGDIIKQKNLFIKNGIGQGEFFINDSISTGTYYLQGFTNFMRNFGKDNVFLQKIEIVNPAEKINTSQPIVTNEYDIQLFPESGYLLENAENVIGIKALINGQGIFFTGKIVDNTGTEISSFEGNSIGMAKTNFTYTEGNSYNAVISINGTIQEILVPEANKTGVIFELDNSIEDSVKITLKTNKATLPSLINDELAVLIYRNNYISEAVTLSRKKSQNTTTQELFFEKEKMQYGVNTVTLFRNNQPIAERKFFIEKPTQQASVTIKEIKAEKDSIEFKIKTSNAQLQPVEANLSLSVLPKDTHAFKETQNIQSAFLLTPYVEGHIENPAFYFNYKSANVKEQLDILLLNQGWLAYALDEKIKEINPKVTYPFQSGFLVKGEIKKTPKGYDIGMLSKNNSLAAFSGFNENNEFAFENIFAYKNDSVKLALVKKNELLVKPLQISFIPVATDDVNYGYLIPTVKNIIFNKSNAQTKPQEQSVQNFQGFPKMEELKEIMLKTVYTKKEQTNYDKENEIAHNHNVIAPSFFQSKKVTEKMEIIHQTVFDYFMSLGYIKRTSIGNYFISLRNAQVTFFGSSKNPDSTYPPKISLDDVQLNRDGDIEMLKELRMTDIDEILINKSGAGGGIDGTGGIIKIYRKKGNNQYYEEPSKNLYESLVLLTGFDRAAEYYTPQFNIYSKEVFNWTEIAWLNNIQTNDKGEAIIKIPTNEFSNEFLFSINGFSEDGLLLNTLETTSKISF